MAKSKPFHGTQYSAFKDIPKSFPKEQTALVSYTIKRYCAERFVTRKQCNTFIRLKWLTVTKSKGKLYVSEICKKEIDEYLGLS